MKLEYVVVLVIVTIGIFPGGINPGGATVGGGFIQGVDVSHWQGDVNWVEVYDAGYRFAFCKATEGVGFTDPYFEVNMNAARDAGVFIGGYHFARPDLDNGAAAEAQYFVEVSNPYLKEGYLRPVLDLERGAELGKQALSSWVHEWMNTVEDETGVQPIIYVNSYYANNFLETSVRRYNLWIAHWTYDPSIPPDTGIWDTWDFWQYSNQGIVPGVNGFVDLDLFNGDIEKLKTFVIGGSNGQKDHPRVMITSPVDGALVAGQITILGEAHDPNGDETIEYVFVQIDSGGWVEPDGKNFWSLLWNTSRVDDGSHLISAVAIDNRGLQSPVDYVTVTVNNEEEPEKPSDLECHGSLEWPDVHPGDLVFGGFVVENIGGHGSELDWEITMYPAWGVWSFMPGSGINLKPGDGPVLVNVTVCVPDEEKALFSGNVTVVNQMNRSDTCTIPVSLTTPKTKLSWYQLFNYLMLRYLVNFPRFDFLFTV
jgi:GH25 family lysozyme M1 (1,4-beta-N-acetylmuramidase)